MTDPRLCHDVPIPPDLAYPEAQNLILYVRLRLALLVRQFWAPAALLALLIVDRFNRAGFLNMLRPLEQVLRRLVVFEALALARQLPAYSPAHQRTRLAHAPAPVLDRQDSSTWRASFAALPLPPRVEPLLEKLTRLAGLKPPRQCGPMRDFYVTRPLALRLEAAIRLALDPARCIRRLARRFKRVAPGPASKRLTAPYPTEWDELNFHLELLAAHVGQQLEPDTS